MYPINKLFWGIVSHNFYENSEEGFDLESEMNPVEKFKIRVEEAQSGIMTCDDLELLWFFEEKTQQKEKKMKKIEVLQWIATAFVLMMQLALNTGMAAWICVALSVCSSITWLACAIVLKSKQLVVTNGVCLAFGLIGVARVFG